MFFFSNFSAAKPLTHPLAPIRQQHTHTNHRGNNKNGRMGNGAVSEASGGGHLNEVMEYTPQPVKGGDGWATISAKGSHTCGLKTDGSAYCWCAAAPACSLLQFYILCFVLTLHPPPP